MRDVLVFGAAVGFANGRRVPIQKAAEPIRWDVMMNRPYTETLVNMISASDALDDPQVLEDDRFEDRILIFEEYANGGLEIIGADVERSAISPSEVVLRLVREALDQHADADVPELATLVDKIGL
jgi:dnd system-associated protein 4